MIKDQQEFDNHSSGSKNIEIKDKHQVINSWKLKQAYQQRRKQVQKKLFGDHYNFSRVGLNKQKKYLLQQQKNTEIQRQNMILLQKLQKIVKKTNLSNIKRRVITQIVQANSVQKEQKNQTPINNRDYQSSSKNSNKQSSKFYISNEYKTPRNVKRTIFNGEKEVDGKIYQIQSSIQQGKCNISIKTDSNIQTIKIDIELYRLLYRTQLEKNHSNIINLLNFDGKIFRLAQINDIQVEIEEQNNLNLPSIHQKIINNQKFFNSKAK